MRGLRGLLMNASSRLVDECQLKEGMEGQGVNTPETSTIFEGVPQRFSYSELSVATGAFCGDSKLGRGGFGSVYKGVLPSGSPVAVKRMNSSMNSQGTKEFEHEISILLQLRHRNLIELRGWCEDRARNEYLVVYELMPNGSLDDVFFKGARVSTCLSWQQRFNILTGTAAALEYLHQGWNRQVIHRDIKCDNIMLDKDWNAKLGDFGIARLVDHEQEVVTTNMAGTFGYIAPEVLCGRFTDKTDVYAFGVVILELTCGRRVWPNPHSHEIGIVPFVRDAVHKKGDLLSVVDKQLTDYDTQQVELALKVGLLCTSDNPDARPSMKRVVRLLGRDEPTIPVLTSTTTKTETKNLAQKFSRWFSGPKPHAGVQGLEAIDVSRSMQKSHSSPAFTVKTSATDTSSAFLLRISRSTSTPIEVPGYVEIQLQQWTMGDLHDQDLVSEYYPALSSPGNDSIPKRRTIAIGVQAHKKFPLEPFAYVFHRLCDKGNCLVVVISCLSRIQDEMGVDHPVDVLAIGGISKNKLEVAVNSQIKNLNHFLRVFREKLTQKGVQLDIWIATGPESHDTLVQAAKKLNPCSVVLDRSFSGHKKRIKAALECNLVLMKKGVDFEILRQSPKELDRGPNTQSNF